MSDRMTFYIFPWLHLRLCDSHVSTWLHVPSNFVKIRQNSAVVVKLLYSSSKSVFFNVLVCLIIQLSTQLRMDCCWTHGHVSELKIQIPWYSIKGNVIRVLTCWTELIKLLSGSLSPQVTLCKTCDVWQCNHLCSVLVFMTLNLERPGALKLNSDFLPSCDLFTWLFTLTSHDFIWPKATSCDLMWFNTPYRNFYRRFYTI